MIEINKDRREFLACLDVEIRREYPDYDEQRVYLLKTLVVEAVDTSYHGEFWHLFVINYGRLGYTKNVHFLWHIVLYHMYTADFNKSAYEYLIQGSSTIAPLGKLIL